MFTGITDTDQRKSCLTLALKAGLDVPSITKLVVENIRSRDSADFSGDADAPLDVTTTKVGVLIQGIVKCH